MKIKGAPMKTMKPKAKAPAAPPVRKMSPKPHIRMQKLKPVPPGAFPTAAAAFPTDTAPPGPDQSIGGGAGGMPPSAAPGGMTE